MAGRQGQDRNEYQLLSRTSHWGWPGLGTGQAEKCALDALCDPGLGRAWSVMPVETIAQPPPHTALVITHSPSLGVLETPTEARLFIDCQLSSLKINRSSVLSLLPTHKHSMEMI